MFMGDSVTLVYYCTFGAYTPTNMLSRVTTITFRVSFFLGGIFFLAYMSSISHFTCFLATCFYVPPALLSYFSNPGGSGNGLIGDPKDD